MSTAATPSASRGEITLQPSYFTSSLFVVPLREDINRLIIIFSGQYLTQSNQPFALFKKVWVDQGWPWMHLRVFDGRARASLIRVVSRLFLERMLETETAMTRVVALFGLYTFFCSQPRSLAPPLHSVKHIAVPIDIFQSLLALPGNLKEPHLLPLEPYATHLMSTLLDCQAFHILPRSELHPQYPCYLPREIFVSDNADHAVPLGSSELASALEQFTKAPPKKKGRPTKREKVRKAKDSLAALEKWLERNTVTYNPDASSGNPASNAYASLAGPSSGPGAPVEKSTHTLLTHPPSMTLHGYRMQKNYLLNTLERLSPTAVGDGVAQPENVGQHALERANLAALTRLKRIDELAAQHGLEVGGHGGEKTALDRVARAVAELPSREGRRGGILGLLEGGGLEDAGSSETAAVPAACT